MNRKPALEPGGGGAGRPAQVRKPWISEATSGSRAPAPPAMAALSCCFHTLLLRVCLSLSPWGEDDEEEEVDLRKSREKS